MILSFNKITEINRITFEPTDSNFCKHFLSFLRYLTVLCDMVDILCRTTFYIYHMHATRENINIIIHCVNVRVERLGSRVWNFVIRVVWLNYEWVRYWPKRALFMKKVFFWKKSTKIVTPSAQFNPLSKCFAPK